MKPERWSFVPTALGLILLAAAAADGHEIMISPCEDDWLLCARFEIEFLGGLWLLFGLSPRWTRALATTSFVAILASDLVRAIAGYPTRTAFGRIAVGPWWVPGSDLVIILALLRWRPSADPSAWIDSHPRRLFGTGLVAAALGIAIDWSQIGQFLIVATSQPVASSSSPGLDYLLYLPSGYYRSLGRWPLILALHGAGATGHDIDRVRREGLPRRIEEKGGLPFIVAAPQSPRGGWDVEALDNLLGEVLSRYRIDPGRVYLTGQSMGGYGTWALATARPERFAAIAPICGGGDPAWADWLRGVPIWAFHGADDRVIPPEESRKMVTAIQSAGGDARLTIYLGIGHDAWTITYDDPGFYVWLLAHTRR